MHLEERKEHTTHGCTAACRNCPDCGNNFEEVRKARTEARSRQLYGAEAEGYFFHFVLSMEGKGREMVNGER